MNANTSVAIINVTLIALVGFVFWHTSSPWAFLLLVCLFSTKRADQD